MRSIHVSSGDRLWEQGLANATQHHDDDENHGKGGVDVTETFKIRAATGIVNTDFLSVTNFFVQKEGIAQYFSQFFLVFLSVSFQNYILWV